MIPGKMVTICIKSWDEKKSWATFSSYHPKDLERRLTKLMGLRKGDAKKLVKRLKLRESILLPLPNAADALAAWPVSSFFVSLGAVVEVAEHHFAQQPTPIRGDHGYLTRKPDAAEALAWLREADSPYDRTITGGNGKGWRGARAITVVQELYDLGAVKVIAVEISGRVERARWQDTSTLVVELPKNPAARARLFRWEAKFARKEGWDPATDCGQDYFLIWRD